MVSLCNPPGARPTWGIKVGLGLFVSKPFARPSTRVSQRRLCWSFVVIRERSRKAAMRDLPLQVKLRSKTRLTAKTEPVSGSAVRSIDLTSQLN